MSTTNNNKGEKQMNRSEILNILAAKIQKHITVSVKTGMWARHYVGEQPTRERICASIPWNSLGIGLDESGYVIDIIYPKLRKNGILAKLR